MAVVDTLVVMKLVGFAGGGGFNAVIKYKGSASVLPAVLVAIRKAVLEVFPVRLVIV